METATDKKRKSLYDNLVKEGYDLPDFTRFSADMLDPDKAQRLHGSLVQEGYDLPDINTFRSDIAPDLPGKSEAQPSAQPVGQEGSGQSPGVPPVSSTEQGISQDVSQKPLPAATAQGGVDELGGAIATPKAIRAVVDPAKEADRTKLFGTYDYHLRRSEELKSAYDDLVKNRDRMAGQPGIVANIDKQIGAVTEELSRLSPRVKPLQALVDKEVGALIERATDEGLEKFTEKTLDGRDIVPNPSAIEAEADRLAAQYNVQDTDLKERIRARMKGVIAAKIIEPEVDKVFEEKQKAIIGEAEKRFVKGFTTDEVESAKATQQINAVKKDVESEFNRENAALQTKARGVFDGLTVPWKQQEAAYAAKFDQYQAAVDAGTMSAEEANAQLGQMKQGLDAAYAQYSSGFASANAQLLKESHAIGARYNDRFEQQQNRIVREANERIQKAADLYAKEFGNDPELRAKLNKAYTESWKQVGKSRAAGIEARDKMMFDVSASTMGLPAAAGEWFAKSTITGLGGAIKGLATTIGSDIGYVLGEEMESAFVLPEAKSDKFTDLLDARNFSMLSGQLLGGMAPSLAASAGTAAATGGASVAVRLLATSLAGWGAETADIAGRAKDQMFERTGDMTKAEEAARKSFVSQVQLLPTYAFEGLPFVGGALGRISSRTGRVAAGGAIEYVTESFQEVPQGIAENNILEGRDAWSDFGEGLRSDETKKTLIAMAPVALLGGAGQVTSQSDAQRMQAAVKSYIGNGQIAKHNEGAANQWVAKMVKEQGVNFSSAVITALHASGNINEEQVKRLVEIQENVSDKLDKAKSYGLNTKEAEVYVAFAARAQDIRAQIEAEQDPIRKKQLSSILDELTNVSADAIGRAGRPFSEVNYVEVKMPNRQTTLMTTHEAQRMFADPNTARVFALIGLGKDGVSIKTGGSDAATLVDEFMTKVQNVNDYAASVKLDPGSAQLTAVAPKDADATSPPPSSSQQLRDGMTAAAAGVRQDLPERTMDDAREMQGKVVEYKGDPGYIDIDEGGKVTFTSVDGKNIVELGNEEGLPGLSMVSEVPMANVVNDDGSVTVYGNTYTGDIEAGTTFDKDGNASVTLQDKDGNSRTFRGDIANLMAYENRLRMAEEMGPGVITEIETNLTTNEDVKRILEEERTKQKRKVARGRKKQGHRGRARGAGQQGEAAGPQGRDEGGWTKAEKDELNALIQQEELDGIEEKMDAFYEANKKYFKAGPNGERIIKGNAPMALQDQWSDMRDTLGYKNLLVAEGSAVTQPEATPTISDSNRLEDGGPVDLPNTPSSVQNTESVTKESRVPKSADEMLGRRSVVVAERDAMLFSGPNGDDVRIKPGEEITVLHRSPTGPFKSSANNYVVYVGGRHRPLLSLIPETADGGNLDDANHFDPKTQLENFRKILSGKLETDAEARDRKVLIAEELIPDGDFFILKPLNASRGFESAQPVTKRGSKWVVKGHGGRDIVYDTKNDLARDIVGNARLISNTSDPKDKHDLWDKQFDWLAHENRRRYKGLPPTSPNEPTQVVDEPTADGQRVPEPPATKGSTDATVSPTDTGEATSVPVEERVAEPKQKPVKEEGVKRASKPVDRTRMRPYSELEPHERVQKRTKLAEINQAPPDVAAASRAYRKALFEMRDVPDGEIADEAWLKESKKVDALNKEYKKLLKKHGLNPSLELIDARELSDKYIKEAKEAGVSVVEYLSRDDDSAPPTAPKEVATATDKAPKSTEAVAEEGVRTRFFHGTTKASADNIRSSGFLGAAGKRTRSAGIDSEGVFLYPNDQDAAKTFTKNHEGETEVVEARVDGRIYNSDDGIKKAPNGRYLDDLVDGAYGWENDLQITEIAKDRSIIEQLRKDGYVGVTAPELGIPVTFVFDLNAISAAGKSRASQKEVKTPTPKEVATATDKAPEGKKKEAPKVAEAKKPGFKVEREAVQKPTIISEKKSKDGKQQNVEYAIPGFEEYPTVAVKTDKGWKVFIPAGGMNVELSTVDHPTKEIAIEAARERLVRNGKEKVDAAIEKQVGEAQKEIDDALGLTSGGPAFQRVALPPTITIDGKERSTTNSKGQPIAQTEEGVRNFWKWFGDSEAVSNPSTTSKDFKEKDNSPTVLYHGTAADFDSFKVGADGTNSNVLGSWGVKRAAMFFTQDQKMAAEFATQGKRSGGSIMPVYISVSKPIDLRNGFDDDAIVALSQHGINEGWMYRLRADDIWGIFDDADNGFDTVKAMKAAGYDGAIITEIDPDTGTASDAWVVFDPSQIKSATGNQGRFSKTSPNITEQRPSDKPAKTGKPNTDNALKALSGVAPGLRIETPKTKEEYAGIISEISDALGSSWGVYDPSSKRIIINPAGPDLKNTLFHEAAHPLLAALEDAMPERFQQFHDEIRTERGGAYRKFSEGVYGDKSERVRMHEALAQFMADVADGKVPVSTKPDSLYQRFKDFIKDILAALGFDVRKIDLSKPDNVRDFATQFKKAMDKGIKVTGLKPVGGVVAMQKADPSKAAQLFKDKGMTAQEAKAYMEARDVPPSVVKDVLRSMSTAKTKEQKAAERLAQQKPATKTGPPLPMSEQVSVESRGRSVVGEGMVTVNEKTALKEQIRGKARAAREAKGDVRAKQKVFAAGVKEMMSKDNLSGRLTTSQSRRITVAAAVTNPDSQKAVDRFAAYADKIIGDANYSEQLDQAEKTRKTIAKSVRKKASEKRDANLNSVARAFAALDIRQANVAEYADIADRLLSNLTKPSVKGEDGIVVPQDFSISNAEVMEFVEKQRAIEDAQAEQDIKDTFEEIAESLGMDTPTLSVKEMSDVIEAMKGNDAAAKRERDREKRKEHRAIMAEVAKVKLAELNAYVDNLAAIGEPITKEQRAIVDDLNKIDPELLSMPSAAWLITGVNSIITNDGWGGMRDFAAKGKAHEFFRAWEGFDFGRPGRNVFSSTDQVAMIASKVARGIHGGANFRLGTGIQGTQDATSDATRQTEQKQARRNAIAKKLGYKDTRLNRYRMGVYAYMTSHFDGTPEEIKAEFDKKAANLLESVERINNKDTAFDDEYEKREQYTQAVNEVLGGATSMEDLVIDPRLKALVENERAEFERVREQSEDSALNDYNTILELQNNYLPTGQRNVNNLFPSEETRKQFERSHFAGRLDTDEASSKKQKTNALGSSSIIDLDMFSVADKSYKEAIADNQGARHVAVMREVMSDPRSLDALGADTHALLKNAMMGLVNEEQNKRDILLAKNLFDKAVRVATKKGRRLALAGVGQLAKQSTVGVSTVIALGKDFPLYFSSFGDVRKSHQPGESWQRTLMEGEQVWERAATMGGLVKVGDPITHEAILRGNEGPVEDAAKRLWEGAGRVADKSMKPLSLMDAFQAQVAWLAFYKAELRKQGVDLSDPTWHKEKNPKAASFANQAVEHLQNANTTMSMPSIYRARGTPQQVLNLAWAFSSFALNMKKRMARDIQAMRLGSPEDKAFAARSFTGSIVETAAYAAMAIGIADIVGMAASSLVSLLFGGDDKDEEDRKARIAESKRPYWQRVLARASFDWALGGQPGVLETQTKDKVLNPLWAHMTTGDQRPLYYVNDGAEMGVYGALVDNLSDLGSTAKIAITGESKKATKGGLMFGKEWQVEDRGGEGGYKDKDPQWEMAPVSDKVRAMSAVLATLSLFELAIYSDQDITRRPSRELSRRLERELEKTMYKESDVTLISKPKKGAESSGTKSEQDAIMDAQRKALGIGGR